MPVHAPWALAIGARLRERFGIDAQAMAGDDGIVVRIPETDADAARRRPVRLRARRDRRHRHRPRSAARRCSPPGSASAPPARCCCRAATPASARRCGSSGSGRPHCSRSPASTRSSRSCSRPCASACRTSTTCRRCVQLMRDIERARGSGSSRSRPQHAVAVRALAAVRLRRRVHLRGRLPARRTPGGGALARPDAARRSCSAGPSCATCSTPASSTQTERELQRLVAGPHGPATPRASPTCCGCSVRCPPPRSPTAAVDRRRRRRRGIAELEHRPPRRRASAIAGVDALGRGRGRRPAARRARRAAADRRPDRVHRAGRRPARRPRRPLRPHARTVHDRRRSPSASASASRSRTTRCGGSRATGRVVEGEFRPGGHGQRVVRRRGAAAAPRAVRSPRSGTRSSRSTPADARPVPARWQHVGGRLRGRSTASLPVVEQLAGVRGARLGARAVRAPQPGDATTRRPMLDELTAAGEVIWAGPGRCPAPTAGSPLHPAETAAPHAAGPRPSSSSSRRPPARARGARRPAARTSSGSSPTPSAATDDQALTAALWDLALGRAI